MTTNLPTTETAAHDKAHERPLSRRTRTTLIVAATAVVAGFYLYCALSVFLMGALLALDIIVCVGPFRFFLSRYMMPPIRALTELISQLLKSMAIRTGPNTHLPLKREDAPRLYDMVEDAAQRVGVAPADDIVLEMINNAGVRLLGYRAGRGGCKLMLGYDMLAILTEAEMRSVLVHEMAHAKLVNRGYSNWVWNCVLRMNQLGVMLGGLVSRMKAKKKRFYAASILLRTTSVFARAGNRLVALYERQDEFAADRIAAEICGSETVRGGLVKMHIADSRSANLSWRDRIVQTQRGGSFSEWLHSELVPASEEERSRLEEKAMLSECKSDYNCHPALPDRLAALDHSASLPCSDGPAIALLSDPDEIADRLIANEEKVIKELEGKDKTRIRKSARASGGSHKFTGGQFVALLTGVLGGLTLLILLSVTSQPGVVVSLCVSLVALEWLSIWLFRRSRFSERVPLPFPSLTAYEQALEARNKDAEEPDWRARTEESLKSQAPWDLRGRKARARYWADICYESLGNCQYKRAWAASELCLKANRRGFEGLMGRCVASAYFGWSEECKKAIDKACESYNIQGSFAWAMGWLTTLFENWEPAEKYLLQTTFDSPGHPTAWALLGHCQWHLGKPRQGLDSLRRAVALNPDEPRQCAMLVKMLLACGLVNEAMEHFEALDRFSPDDVDIRLCGVRANALLGRAEEAERRANELIRDKPGDETLLSLAQAYHDARLPEQSKSYYKAVCEAGFNPDAYVGLARLEYESDHYEEARSYLMSALDLTRERGPGAPHPLNLLDVICRGLISITEPVNGCAAWKCNIDLPEPLEGVGSITFTIWARTQHGARELALELYRALYPGREEPSALAWEPVAREEQPTEPSPPGLYAYRFNTAAEEETGKKRKRRRAA